MSKIYIYKFNNYYNRIIKKYNTIGDYTTNGTLIHLLSSTNFNPNDGMETEHIIGTTEYTGTGDYLIVTDGTTSNNIVSRWFILGHQRTKSGQ